MKISQGGDTLEDLKKILLAHYDRYPLMQIEDFLKILYQNTFGPKHLGADPTLSKIQRFLAEELLETRENPQTPFIEDIGGDYCRVSLDVLLLHKMTVEELGNFFLSSMKNSPERNEESIKSFIHKTDQLMELVNFGQIPLPKETSRNFLKTYLASGVQPMHHSSTYEQSYEPHYRVVNKSLLGI